MTAPGPGRLLSTWEFDPGLVAALVLTAGLYLRRAWRRAWPRWRTACFLAGLAAAEVALQSGFDYYGDRLLSVHMVSHLLLTLVAAPLLLAGAPVELALRALPSPSRHVLARVLRNRSVRLLGHPVIGLAALAVAAFATHLTNLYALALTHPALHAAEHALYLVCALVFWSVVLPPGPVPARVGGLGRIGYVLLAMPIMSVVAVALGSGDTARYPPYVTRSAALGVSAVDDQRVAAAVMWVGGSLMVTVVVLAVAWWAMVAEERRTRRRELILDRRARARGARPGELA